jgi:ABC-2 type transport system permease protein
VAVRILALMLKEFLALWRDPRGRLILIVPPLLQTLVFGYAATFDLRQVPLAVYNEDGGEAARELVARFAGSHNFEVVAHLEREAQIAQQIDSRRAVMALHLRPDFSRHLLNGDGAVAQIVVDGRNSNAALITLGYANAIVQRFNDDWAAQHGLRGPPAQITPRAWFNPNLESRWFIVPGLIGLLAQLVSLLVTALSVAREREQGTFDQLLVTPLRPVELMLGKTLPAALVGLADAGLILLIAVLWFRIPFRGDLLLLFAGIGLFLLSTIGIGLVISSMVKTQQQALLGAFLFMVPSVILSGFATPIANMPIAVQYLTYLNPLRYFLVVARGVFLEDLSFGVLVHQYWPLALMGSVTLGIATWLFRQRLQ